MAGIGFKLKKIYSRKGILAYLEGSIYSIFTTIGNILFVMITMFIINYLMIKNNVGNAVDLFTILLYCFVFSLIFTSGISMVMSRYIADKIYKSEFSYILPSAYGGLSIIMPFMALVGVIFLYFSTFTFKTKFLIFIIYIEAGITTYLSTYISAVKAYREIALTYALGMIVTIILSIILLEDATLITMLFTIACGFTVISLGLFLIIIFNFEKSKKNPFDFIRYIPVFYKLFIISTLLSATNYMHNFLFWTIDELRYSIGGNFICSPSYDSAVFIGVLSSLSATVMFVVKTETNFYDKYKEYLRDIKSGTYTDIEKSRKGMKEVIKNEITFITEIQFIISIIFIIISVNLLPILGFDSFSLELIPFFIAGYFFNSIVMCLITLLLYFEGYNKVLKISLINFILTIVLTILTIFLGRDYYGLSMVISGAISLAIVLRYISETLENINYKVFCNYPMFDKSKKSYDLK